MKRYFCTLLTGLVLLAGVATASAQGTAFTYQGRLNDTGNPANGAYDLKFSVFDAATGGGQKGASLTNPATGITNGLFTVQLDFGGGIFDGTARWLEIGVRINGGGAFATLSPRQPINETPYAIEAGNVSGTVALANLPTTILVTNGQTNVNLTGSFAGNGGGLNNLSVYSLAGTTTNPAIVAWGNNAQGQLNVPSGLTNITAVAAGGGHSMALKSDRTVVAWGDNTSGQTNIPPGLSNVVAIAAGYRHSMALKSDGTVVAWGDDSEGDTNVPPGLSNVIAIAGGYFDSVALRSDGTVVAWGYDTDGESDVPPGLNNVTAVAAGIFHDLALKNDGTVVVWGDNSLGQTNVPAGLSNVVAIAAGGFHSMALKADGTVVQWGAFNFVPPGLSNVVAIAAGYYHSTALQTGGTVVVWGDTTFGLSNVPPTLVNPIALAPGSTARHVLTIELPTISPAALLNQNNTFAGYNTFNAGAVFAGPVGIGTNDPQQLLHLNVASGFGEGMEIDSAIAGHAPAVYLNHTGVNGLNFRIASYGDNSTPGHFAIRDEGSAVERLTIDSSGVIAGNGNGLTSLNAVNLTGAVPSSSLTSVPAGSLTGAIVDARLSANVPRLNGTQTFTAANTFSSAGNSFTGNGNGLTSLNAANLTGSVPSASLTSVPAGNLTGSIADARLSANVALLNRNGQTFTGNNTIASTGNLSFASQTRQMLNLWSTVYAIGVQSLTMYFRVDSNGGGAGYAWYKGGSHSDTQNDPGPGGTTLMRLDTAGNLNISGGFGSLSDRNAKERFEPVDAREVLDKVNALPLSRWSYKTDPAARHLGPMAQDFRAAFEVGFDDKSICTVDEGGVALAAIQGLNQKLEDTNKRLEAENTELKTRLERLEQLVNSKTRDEK